MPGSIEHIEVENFKSYKGSHTIPFTAFTSVIGTNGSGKSNLMDAICFVLGMKTQRLRGSNLKELVFKGHNETKPSATTCYVLLSFKKNKNHTQTFQRKIQVSQGTSKYYIDNQEVSHDKYDEVLREMGVMVTARNFLVFQGDVESIANQSPKELTAFIEKVSGSEEDKQEYETCRAEMEKAEDNTLFTFNKKKTINAERKQYKEQKEEAEKYHSLQKELAEMKKNHMLWQLYHIDKDIKSFAKEAETDTDKLAEAEAKKERRKKELQEASSKSAAFKKDVLKLEKDITTKKAQFDKSRPDAIKRREQLEHTERRVKASKESLAKVNKEYNQQQEDIKKLQDDYDNIKISVDKITEEETQTTEKLKLTKTQLAEYNKLKDAVGGKTAENRKEVETSERRVATLQEEHARQTHLQAQLTRELEGLKATKKQMTERKAALEVLIEATNEDINKLKDDAKKRDKDKADAEKKHEEYQAKLNSIQANLTEAKAERKESDRDRRFKEAIISMQRLFPAVRGRLVELTKPTQKKYEVAISVAMGKYLDAVVVDDERTARECIQYLKEQRVGTCTFLPLDSLRPKAIDEKLRSQGARFVLDLLSFEPFLHNAVLFAAGSTLVADDINEARHLAFGGDARNRVVTTKGVLIAKSGLISGGSAVGDKSRWDDQKVDKLKKDREAVLIQLADTAKEVKNLTAQQHASSGSQGAVASLENKVKFATQDKGWVEDQLNKFTKLKSEKEGELNRKIIPLLQGLDDKITAEKNNAAAARKKIDDVTDEHFGAFCKSVGVANIREYEQDRLAAFRERTEKKVKHEKQLGLLKSQINYETQRDVKTPLEKLQTAIKNDEAQLASLRKETQKDDEGSRKFDESLRELLDEQKDAKRNMDEVEIDIKEKRRALASTEKDIGDIQKRMAVAETQVHQARAKKRTLIRQARVEELKLPLPGTQKGKGKRGKKSKSKGKKRARQEDGEEEAEEEEEEEEEEEDGEFLDYDAIDLEAESGASYDSMNSQSTQGVAVLAKVDAIELDYSEVRGEVASNTKDYEDKNAKWLQNMQDVEAKMANLAPNLKAVQRLDDVDDRLSKTNTELEGVRNEAKEKKDKFEEVRARRRDKFMGAFDKISNSIQKIYQELTASPDHKELHGAAYLHLENTDDPYLAGIKYTTMPPMKRFRDMEQLSGGEKTVAALALLFAAHTHRPSPFFILDEVDAALDSSNVQLVARYIRQHSKECQFIVISLKDSFYDKSNALVGICRDVPKHSSKAFTLSLEGYPE